MSHPALLHAKESVLVVIDIQERLLPVMSDGPRMLENSRRLILAAGTLGIPIIVSEQYPKGLGSTEGSLRETLTTAGKSTSVHSVEKTTFSCTGSDAFLDILEDLEREQVILCGIEAHVCVLQTALGLHDQGAMPFVVQDAVASRSAANREAALTRMAAAGVILTVTESVIFELLEDCKHPAFKTLAALVK